MSMKSKLSKMRKNRIKKATGKPLAVWDMVPQKSYRKSTKARYRRQLCTTTFLCDAMDGGNFVKLFPDYVGKTIILETNKYLELPQDVGEYLEATGRI